MWLRYSAQRAVNHRTLDRSTRVRMELPARFEMKELLSLLDKRRENFNIRASQDWGSLYVLDLNETYNFLEELDRTDDSAQYDLCEFIDHRILKFNKWLRCIKDCDPTQNLLVSEKKVSFFLFYFIWGRERNEGVAEGVESEVDGSRPKS